MNYQENYANKGKHFYIAGLLFTLLSTLLIVGGLYINNQQKREGDKTLNQPSSSPNKQQPTIVVETKEVENLYESIHINRLPLPYWNLSYQIGQNPLDEIKHYSQFGTYYREDKTLMSKISNEFRIRLVLNNLSYQSYPTTDGVSCSYMIPESDLQVAYRKFFDSTVSYEYIESKGACPTFVRNDEKNIEISECCKDIESLGVHIYSVLEKADKTEEELYLYERMGVYDDTTNTYYKDLNLKHKVRENFELPSFDIRVDYLKKNLEKFTQYKYTFKIKNDQYYLYSVERN